MRPRATSARLTPERSTRVAAVAALALAVAFVAWLLVRGDHSSSSPATVPATSAAGTTTGAKPILEAASVARLEAVASAAGHPVYWAGPRAGTTYELTRTTDGRIYVRYLPKGVKLGDRRSIYLIVATYPVPNAYRAVLAAARQQGARTFGVAGGGKALVNAKTPTNVYLAYPGSSYQIEVYDPKPGRARALVASGKIRRVGAG